MKLHRTGWTENWQALLINTFDYRIDSAGCIVAEGSSRRIGLLLMLIPVITSVCAIAALNSRVWYTVFLVSIPTIPFAIYYLALHEKLTITPNSIHYRRDWIVGSRSVVAPRDSLSILRLVERVYEYESRFTIYTVELVFTGYGLPGFIKLHESFDSSAEARYTAECISDALSLPLQKAEFHS